ncbi:MAG: hypothetical protein QOG50_2911, partial [Actinomycetota bacterium]|nr:hypothetical protein [Actinomycetota bacterium]
MLQACARATPNYDTCRFRGGFIAAFATRKSGHYVPFRRSSDLGVLRPRCEDGEVTTPYESEPVDRLPFGSADKAARYATERYRGASGLNWWRCDPTLQFLMRYHL